MLNYVNNNFIGTATISLDDNLNVVDSWISQQSTNATTDFFGSNTASIWNNIENYNQLLNEMYGNTILNRRQNGTNRINTRREKTEFEKKLVDTQIKTNQFVKGVYADTAELWKVEERLLNKFLKYEYSFFLLFTYYTSGSKKVKSINGERHNFTEKATDIEIMRRYAKDSTYVFANVYENLISEGKSTIETEDILKELDSIIPEINKRFSVEVTPRQKIEMMNCVLTSISIMRIYEYLHEIKHKSDSYIDFGEHEISEPLDSLMHRTRNRRRRSILEEVTIM